MIELDISASRSGLFLRFRKRPDTYIETNVTDSFLGEFQARQQRDREMFKQGKAEDKLGAEHAG